MKQKKQQIKNARVLTPEEMKEIRELIPHVFCSDGKLLECTSGTSRWQIIGDQVNPKGLRCDNQIQMCNGGNYSSGSSAGSEYIVECGRSKGIHLMCRESNGDIIKYDEVFYEPSTNPYNPEPQIAGIKCGNEYIFCNGERYPGGSSGSNSGSSGSGSGGSGSGSVSGSGPYREYDDPQKNLL